MKGCSAIVVVIVTLVAMPFPVVARAQARQGRPRFTAFPLKHANAANSTKKLKALLGKSGDVEVFSEERTNTVFIRACPENIQQAKKILDRLDVGVPNYLTIIPLRHADAVRTSNKLQAILTLASFFGDDRNTTVTADERGNAIIISGSEETMQQAKEILYWLDHILGGE